MSQQQQGLATTTKKYKRFTPRAFIWKCIEEGRLSSDKKKPIINVMDINKDNDYIVHIPNINTIIRQYHSEHLNEWKTPFLASQYFNKNAYFWTHLEIDEQISKDQFVLTTRSDSQTKIDRSRNCTWSGNEMTSMFEIMVKMLLEYTHTDWICWTDRYQETFVILNAEQLGDYMKEEWNLIDSKVLLDNVLYEYVRRGLLMVVNGRLCHYQLMGYPTLPDKRPL